MTALRRTGFAFLGAASLSIACVIPTTAQTPSAGGPGGGRAVRPVAMSGGIHSGELFLLRNTSVQQELSITEAQRQRLEHLEQQVGEFFRQNSQGGSGGHSGARLEPQAMQQRFQALQTRQQAAIAQILDMKQRMRLAQIELQQAGGLQRRDVQDHLALSTAQRSQMRTIGLAAQQQIRAMSQGLDWPHMSEANRQKAIAKLQAVQEAATGKLMAVLTTAQKQRLKTILGKPFKLVNDPK